MKEENKETIIVEVPEEEIEQVETVEDYEIIGDETSDKEERKRIFKNILAGGAIVLCVGVGLAALKGVSDAEKAAEKYNPEKDDNKNKIEKEEEVEEKNTLTVDDISYNVDFGTADQDNYTGGKKVVASGDINVDEIVTDSNGVQWVDKEAMEDSKNISNNNTKIDEESNTVDGGYEYIDKDGNVEIGSDSSKLPNGYYKDPKTGKIIPIGTVVDENGNIVSTEEETEEILPNGTITNEKIEMNEAVIEGAEWAEGEYDKFINSDDYNCYELDGKLYYGTYTSNQQSTNSPEIEKEEVKEEIIEEETKEEVKEEIIEEETKEEVKEEIIEEETKEETTEVYYTEIDGVQVEWASGEFEKFLNSEDYNCYIAPDGKLYYGTEPVVEQVAETEKTLVLK